ncbi:MAG: 16S rRNA processing protein RimM [Chloroflexi bacterium]|nr:16S rRNA processing protein RimM [Chloroflexota bacterium]
MAVTRAYTADETGKEALPLAASSPSTQHEPERVVVGRVLGTWGLRGDLRVQPLTDNPERFQPGQTVWLRGVPRRIEASRAQKGQVILKLSGVARAEEAEALRGEVLEVPIAEVPALSEDWYYHFQLVGLQVWTEDGRFLGAIADILETGANDVYIVRGADREYLIPAIAEVVQQVDLEAGRMTIRELPGLLE